MSGVSKSTNKHYRVLYRHIGLHDQSLETVEKFCYFGDTTGARWCATDSVITRIRKRRSKFRDLVPLLTARRRLHLKAKDRLFSACVN